MSAENKTRFEIQTIIKKNLATALDKLHLEGWDIMEFANASFEKADKILLYNLISVARLSWNGVKYETVDGKYMRVDEWLEQQMWQIHVICKRTDDIDDDSIVAEDVANRLVAWYNGLGCDLLRVEGVANVTIDTDSIFVYNDNSGLYQKRVVFTVKIQVPKKQKYEQLDAQIKGIYTRPV